MDLPYNYWTYYYDKIPNFENVYKGNPPDRLKEVIVSFPIKEKEQNMNKINKL
eukprot:Pgem_evm1s6338